jgi:signal transduction histidine kinase
LSAASGGTAVRDGRQWFWWLNLTPWAVYLGFNLVFGASYGMWRSGVLLLFGVIALALYLVSGGLRAVALRRGWLELDGWPLTGRLLVGVMAGALLMQAMVALVMVPTVALGWVAMPGGRLDYRPGVLLVYWFNATVVLGLWTAGWAGARVLERARRSEIARLRAEAARHALERDALRARLNPHFVFNALNNLRALINEDTERAREMVTRLSNTLRHALEQNDREQVRLAEELAVVDDYLAIEAVHYEQRLRVHRQIAADAWHARLPPMALQLLVENAIRHGIAVTPGGGELDLRAHCAEGKLRLEVANPGRLGKGNAGHGVGLAYLRAHLGRDGRFELAEHDGRVVARLEIAQ